MKRVVLHYLLFVFSKLFDIITSNVSNRDKILDESDSYTLQKGLAVDELIERIRCLNDRHINFEKNLFKKVSSSSDGQWRVIVKHKLTRGRYLKYFRLPRKIHKSSIVYQRDGPNVANEVGLPYELVEKIVEDIAFVFWLKVRLISKIFRDVVDEKLSGIIRDEGTDFFIEYFCDYHLYPDLSSAILRQLMLRERWFSRIPENRLYYAMQSVIHSFDIKQTIVAIKLLNKPSFTVDIDCESLECIKKAIWRRKSMLASKKSSRFISKPSVMFPLIITFAFATWLLDIISIKSLFHVILTMLAIWGLNRRYYNFE